MSFEKDVKASCSSSVNSTSSVAEAFFASLGVGRLPAQSPMMAAKSLDLPVPLGPAKATNGASGSSIR